MSHIVADFVVNDDSIIESESDRERSFFEKKSNSVVQRYNIRSKELNLTKIINGESNREISDLVNVC